MTRDPSERYATRRVSMNGRLSTYGTAKCKAIIETATCWAIIAFAFWRSNGPWKTMLHLGALWVVAFLGNCAGRTRGPACLSHRRGTELSFSHSSSHGRADSFDGIRLRPVDNPLARPLNPAAAERLP